MGEWETFTRCDKHKEKINTCMYYTEGNRFRLKQRLIKLNKTLRGFMLFEVVSFAVPVKLVIFGATEGV